MRPAWCSNPADIPPRTQLVLWRSDERGDLPAAAKTDVPTGGVLAGGKPQQDTDEPAPAATWTAVMAFSGDDVRADLHGDIGPESDGQKSVDGGTSGGNLPSGGNVVGSSVAGIIDPSTISGRFRLKVASNRAGRTAPTPSPTWRRAPIRTPSSASVSRPARVATASPRLTDGRCRKPCPGFGWCTWDSLGRDVSEAAIVERWRSSMPRASPCPGS